MNRSRGTYRAVYSVIVDDPDFQRMHSRSRHVLLTARVCEQAGPACIWRYYPEVLACQTGYTVRQIAEALDELARETWVLFDQQVLWIRNGLRYDPWTTLANKKHRASVEKWLRKLPRSPIVVSFCDYYHLPYPFGTHSVPMTSPSDSHAIQGFPIPDSRFPIPETATALSGDERPTLPGIEDLANGNGHHPTREIREHARLVLAFLNEKTGRAFRFVEANLRPIEARLKSGATVQDCKSVIARKNRDWGTDPKMAKYLRVETIFNATKFEGYLAELGT